MKILVAGGAGFIGSNFIHHLLQKYPDYEVVNFDKLTYAGNLDNLKDVEANSRYTFIRGDIADQSAVEAVLGVGIEAVVNFAAETHVDRSIHVGSRDFVLTNTLGVETLLDAERKQGTVKRHVQISTDEVYGSLDLDDSSAFTPLENAPRLVSYDMELLTGSDGPKRAHGSMPRTSSLTGFTEETPFQPNVPYAAAKAGGDLLCRAFYKTFNSDVVVTHCSNNYGPYQFPEKLIPFFIDRAINDQPLPLYGDGKNVRDWLYVQDHCEAIDAVLHKGKAGEVYNIGGHFERNNLEIARLILKALGKPESLITFVADRPAHDRRYAIDAGKIERELGWKPRYNFDLAIQETITWYRENAEWVKTTKERTKNINAHLA